MLSHIIRERRSEVRAAVPEGETDERRRYTRITNITSTVRLMTCDQAVKVLQVPMVNITQGGMLVRSSEPVPRGTLVALQWPDGTVNELVNVHILVRERDGSMLGRVVRLTVDDDNLYEIAIEFLKKGL